MPGFDMNDEDLLELFGPYLEELEQSQRMGQQGRRMQEFEPRQRQYATPLGAFVGGLGSITGRAGNQFVGMALEDQADKQGALVKSKLRQERKRASLADRLAALERERIDREELLADRAAKQAADLEQDANKAMLALESRNAAESASSREWDRRNAIEAPQRLAQARAAAGMANSSAITREERAEKRALEREERSDTRKKEAQAREIEERYRGINTAIGELEDRIQNHGGTYEATGPQNELIEGLKTSIATDLAKLRDPESVARESEVANEMKALWKSGLWTRDSTALDILRNVKARVGERRAEAYRVRGIPAPQAPVSPAARPDPTAGWTSEKQARLEELRRKKAAEVAK